MKTKLEIIEETAAFYNANNRAMENGHCMYVDPNGNKCALGRCMIEEKAVEANSYKAMSGPMNAIALVNAYMEAHKIPAETSEDSVLDSLLLEEYRGHSVYFWRNLQNLHDNADYWNDQGLTPKGLKAKQDLIEYFVGK